MPKNKSLAGKVLSRVPPEWEGLQLNVCRNPNCQNFGKWPLQKVGRHPGPRDGYRVVGGWLGKEHTARVLSCTFCGESFQMKSNRAISEELVRIWRPHLPPPEPSCSTPDCGNGALSIHDHPAHYQRFGKTDAGSSRYRCKACRKTFSVPNSPTHRQRQSEKNDLIFRCLVNKVPMRRICEVADANPAVLYHRIHFIHRQCERFAHLHERTLAEGKQFPELRIAVDRQDHVLNWGSTSDRRNTKLVAIASAENNTGYVFGMHLDYDPDVDPYEADLHAREIGDYETEWSFRAYSRIWLPRDWNKEADVAPDVPIPEDARLPQHGSRVYSTYTMAAHFLFLRRLLPGAGRMLFYLDPDPGIRAACLTAFRDDILRGDVHAFLIRINKSLTVDRKRLALAAREQKLRTLRHDFGTPRLGDWNTAHRAMELEYRHLLQHQKRVQDRWTHHLLPNMGEPEKAVCYLTERGTVSASDVATMMLHASLHSVDRYFMQIRRRVSLLERPIQTASAGYRVWHGGAAYNPEIAAKLMDIFRVVYNFSLVGQDRKTPAVRLGIATERFSLQDILDA